ILHRQGFRFRVQLRVKAAAMWVRPDVVFNRERVAIFIDGCYWHCCPEHGTQPRINPHYWQLKLKGNVVRDRTVDRCLRDSGWLVMRVWEHTPAEEGVALIIRAVRLRRLDG